MRVCVFLFSLSLFALVGCGSGSVPGTSSSGPPPPPPVVTFNGNVQGNQMVIVGASVQLYAASVTGNGSSPTPLLKNALTTDAKGAFSVSPSYACPSATSTLYVVAERGKLPSATSDNAAIRLMAVVGSCGATTTASTSIVVNEVTTAASVWALSPFLSTGGNVGASPTNAQGLANAVSTVANLVNLGTGTSPGRGIPSNVTVATAKLNTLANVLTSCVASTDGSACAALFSTAAVGGVMPTNTLDAAFNIVRNPETNVAAVYALSIANPVFLPTLSSAPPDWFLYSTITGGGIDNPAAIAVDGSGNVWVSNFYDALSEFAPSGAPIFPSGLSGYGINQSYGMTLDADNNVWIANEQTSMNSGNGDITKLSPSGETLSGQTGFSAGGIFFPIGMAADTNGNIWVADSGDSNITLLNSGGVPISGSGFARGYVALPVSIAIDSSHNAWVGNGGADFVTKISPDGSLVSNINCCNIVSGVAVDQGGNVWAANYGGASVSLISNTTSSIPSVNIFSGGGLDTPNGIAIDGAGAVWVPNYHSNTVSVLAGSASASPGTFLSGSGLGNDANLGEPYAAAIDASGNVWISNASANTVTEFIGAAVPVKTPLVGPPQLP
jgi:streptogramin lyase